MMIEMFCFEHIALLIAVLLFGMILGVKAQEIAISWFERLGEVVPVHELPDAVRQELYQSLPLHTPARGRRE